MTVKFLVGDCRAVLKTLAPESISCVVTSPPYFGLRDYGVDGQMGLEPTPDAFVTALVEVFREVRRVLRDDGTLWLNLGDSYNNRTKVRTTSHQPALNGFVDDNWAERASRGGVRMSYTDGGLKEKDLIGIPWRVAFALQADGWWLRQDIIWSKPNPMPESVTDRCTRAHEYLFMFTKSARYYYDAAAVAEPIAESSRSRIAQPTFESQTGGEKDYARTGENPNRSARKALENFADKQRGHGTRHAGFNERFFEEGGDERLVAAGVRNRRSVWTITTKPFKGAHFATFPPDLAEPCILAGCPEGGTVLDPFGGAGTTGLVADRLDRNAMLIELNPAYVEMAETRLREDREKRAAAQPLVTLADL